MDPSGPTTATVTARWPRSVGAAALVAVLVVLVVAACADDDPAGDAEPTTTTATVPAIPGSTGGPTTTVGDPRVELDEVIALDQPVALVVRPGSDLVYIAERAGRVWSVSTDGDAWATVGDEPVLDLTRVVESGSSEQGLLGIAFDPGGNTLFVDYIRRGGRAGTTKVVRYEMDGDAVDDSSATELFSVAQPFANHNGGHLVVGPDEKLYVGLGDGGSQGDPNDHGRDLSVPFAKILRMDLDGSNREVWASGLRNPWRFSFDAPTGDLWIGDVGGGEREEVDHLPGGGPDEPGGKGADLGWSLREGTLDSDKDGDRSDLVDPVFEYSHDEGGCSIVGGFVYRGTAVPGLVGRFVFGDHCQSQIRALDPADPGSPLDIAEGIDSLSSFGVDGAGELYALSLDGPVYRLAPSS